MKELDPVKWGLHDSEIGNIKLDYKLKKVIFEINLIIDEIKDKKGNLDFQYKKAVLEFYKCSTIICEAKLENSCSNIILEFVLLGLLRNCGRL